VSEIQPRGIVTVESQRVGPYEVRAVRAREGLSGFVQIKKGARVFTASYSEAGALGAVAARMLDRDEILVEGRVRECSAEIVARLHCCEDDELVLALESDLGEIDVAYDFARDVALAMCRMAWAAHDALDRVFHEAMRRERAAPPPHLAERSYGSTDPNALQRKGGINVE
jgi:hypothetical protein